jgi:Zn-dependent peptidase ImmA (M78 family)/DNA-binding XRE family transcriptional regulator
MNQFSSLHSVAYLFNPESLKVAREFRGLQKNELAGLLELTPSAITQFESGQVRPNPQTIARMSMALGFPPPFFSQYNQLQPISSDQCHFRSLVSCSQMERRRMASAGTVIRRIVEFVDEHVNLPPEQVTSNIIHKPRTTEEIEEAANTMRRRWGLGLGPIPSVVHLLETKGVLIFRLLDDCKKVDAFSNWHRHRPFIFLNTEKGSGSRSRLDAAHELGHLIMHEECLPGDRRQEEQAFRFAGAFLLPRESFLRECPRRLVWAHYLELKKHWKVSLAALVRRARDLGVMSEDTYRRANVQLNQKGWKYSEPEEPMMEFPTILSQSINLLSQKGWTLPKISQHLYISETDLVTLTYADAKAAINSP